MLPLRYCLKGNNFCPDQPCNAVPGGRAAAVYARCKDFSGLCWLVFLPFSLSVRCARRSRELIPRQRGHRVSIAYSLWRAGRYLLAAHSSMIRALVYSHVQPNDRRIEYPHFHRYFLLSSRLCIYVLLLVVSQKTRIKWNFSRDSLDG